MGRAVKNSLEIIIKQVHLEGGFKRGGRIRVAGCLRQIVPNRWASVRKKDISPNVSVFTRGVTKQGEVEVFNLASTRELPSLVTSSLSLTSVITAGAHWLTDAYHLFGT